jgi:MSHA pilin protein MshC
LRNNKAFTLVELIATLLIMTIVGSVVVSRTSSVHSFQVNAEFDELKTHLRFAQRRALKTNSSWGIHFNSSADYWLFKENPSNRKKLPDKDAVVVSLIALNITNAPLTITFDGFGSPGQNPVSILTAKGALVVDGGTGFVD